MKLNTHNLTLIALYCARISILSIISIPVGIVPFSLSLFAIIVTAIVLKPINSVLAVLCYILIGALGIPVFSGFRGGLHTLFGPTGGFIFAYIFVAFIISTATNKKEIYIKSFLSLLVLYFLGTAQYSIVAKTSFLTSLKICVLPFILFDIVKVFFAVKIGYKLKNIPYHSK